MAHGGPGLTGSVYLTVVFAKRMTAWRLSPCEGLHRAHPRHQNPNGCSRILPNVLPELGLDT